MLFILLGLLVLGAIAINIVLFSLDLWLGLTGVVLMVLLTTVMGRRLFRTQNSIQEQELTKFKESLLDIIGFDEGREVHTALTSMKPSYYMQLALSFNEQYRQQLPSRREGIISLIALVESIYGNNHPSLQKLQSLLIGEG